MDPLRPEPTHGALDRTAELLAKLLSGSEDPDVTALSEAVKAKLGITDAPDWSIRGAMKHGTSPRTGSSGGEPGATDWSV